MLTEIYDQNTRITDAEVFERRYPVLLREFSLRAGSGGAGKHRGGDGVIRDIEFRRPVQVSILSERRSVLFSYKNLNVSWKWTEARSCSGGCRSRVLKQPLDSHLAKILLC